MRSPSHCLPSAVPLSLHDDAPISTAESTRDLGVFVTTNFKPSLNARLAVSRARARLFQMRRGFVVMTTEAFLPLYLSLIRPILEYAIQAVSPDVKKGHCFDRASPEAGDSASKRSQAFPV